MTKLIFPGSILKQHLVVLGKTGAGKSSALRHIVEHLLRAGKRVCIVDPKGDWWGLKVSADGKGAGFPVIAFGDFKDERASDVPINKHSGKHVAELISSGNRPCVIGFRGWMTAHMVQFWIDFASTLFNANPGELYLVGDEFHNFAPKGKIMDPESGKCLHWSNRLMSEGRGLGLICLIASQRPQKVHNDTLTCCETLVAMRVIHAADRKAVKVWIDGCGDPKLGKEMLESLAGIPRGAAYVWSPEIGYGPERVTFPMFETFDSFAPPQLQQKTNQQGWASVDLGEVKEKLAKVVEEAKANDPAELKRKVAALTKELNAKAQSRKGAEVKEVIREVPVLGKDDLRLLEVAIGNTERMRVGMEDYFHVAKATFDSLKAALQRIQNQHKQFPVRPGLAGSNNRNHVVLSVNAPRVAVRNPAPENVSNGELGKAERLILTAAIQRHPRPSTNAQLALMAGYSVSSGGFNNSLGRLRSGGYLTGGGNANQVTQLGLDTLSDVPPLPTGPELLDIWRGRLGKAERTILEVVAGIPDGVDREQLAVQTGYSHTSGGFNNALGKLRTLELICKGWPARPAEELL